MKLALAQINSQVGDILSNEKKIISFIQEAHKKGAELVLFPEMALVGYPILDLVFNPLFLKKNLQAIKRIHKKVPLGMAVLLGCLKVESSVSNAVVALRANKPLKFFSKEYLADFQVFDEKRYFKKGKLQDNIFKFKNLKIQLLICEEIWKNPSVASHLLKTAPDLIVSFNASPFEQGKDQKRKKKTQAWTKKYKAPVIYLNSVGGQEELIFDGASFILNKNGEKIYQGPSFKEDLKICSFPFRNKTLKTLKKKSLVEITTEALIFGLKEFIEKNNFKKCHIGLSGGVDSAVVASIATRALGKKNIKLIFLPGPFTSRLSEKCAHKQAQKLECPLEVYSINNSYHEALKELEKPPDITCQNLQARLRALFLMATANSNPESLLLACSNKSELAIGYSTLYGDLAGGLLPIGDLFKTEVYEVARHLKVIEAIIKRKPTAELARDQIDEDHLPPYEKLDPVLIKLIEKKGGGAITKFEKDILNRIVKSEFKRRQAPPVLKVKSFSFDKGWRLSLSIKTT